MAKDEAVIKGALDYVLANTFEDYRKYISYFIRIVPKELSSKHGHYKRKERLIEIFNLSREHCFTMLTCLHELAHHIEFEDLNESDHGETFYERYYKILRTAIGLGYLQRNDVAREDDSSDYKALQRYYGDVDTWEIPKFDFLKKRMVVIRNGYNYRNALKACGYHWFSLSQTWQKEFPDKESAMEEKKRLLEFGQDEDIMIQYEKQVNFLMYYYIGVLNGYEYRYGLKELGYQWEGYGVKNTWVKKIDAIAYYEELAKLTQFAGIEFKKVTPNEKRNKTKLKEKKSQTKKVIQYYV